MTESGGSWQVKNVFRDKITGWIILLEGFAISILFLAVASYYDLFEKRIIPNWLTYTFLAAAVAFSLFTEGFVLARFGIGVAVFLIGYLVYRLGYLGGADVFIISGLVFLLPLYMGATPSIISVLLISTILMALYLETAFFARGTGFSPTIQEKATAAIWAIGYGAVAYMLYIMGFAWFAALALAVGIVSSIFALIKKDLTKSLVTWVKPRDIIEEDILAVEELDGKIIEKYGLERLLTAEQIKKVKKSRMRKVPVYGNLPPYIPFILLGVLGTLVVAII